VFGPGVDAPLVQYEGAGTTSKNWLYANQQGSVVALANASGATTGSQGYGPFGETRGTPSSRFGYTGQQYLPPLGLYYYKARMYSPGLGRFLQTDPVGYKDDLNWYAYVGNNPVNLMDPSGMIASLSGSFASSGSTSAATNVAAQSSTGEAKLDAPPFRMPATVVTNQPVMQVAGVITDPSHYINRVGAGNINSVVGTAVGIALSPGFVGTTQFGMTVNGVNYNVRAFVLPNGNINLGTIHPDDGRHR
jgi:RHS repeat-associated protein